MSFVTYEEFKIQYLKLKSQKIKTSKETILKNSIFNSSFDLKINSKEAEGESQHILIEKSNTNELTIKKIPSYTLNSNGTYTMDIPENISVSLLKGSLKYIIEWNRKKLNNKIELF